MSDVDPRSRATATWIVLSARLIYAYNWYDIGGVLPLVGARFGIGTVELGIVLASFLIGAAVFQLPAGYVALAWGSRATSIAALGVMGVFSLASAFSPNWVVLALLRFGAGGGAAFFFAPALGLVTAYYPSDHRGFMVGAYNGAFSLGSGIGLFASAYLGPISGWALPLGLGGVLLLGITLVAFALPVTPHESRVPARGLWKASAPVFRSPGLWGIAVGGGGLWGGFYIAAQYFVNFAHQVHPSWSLVLAAAAPTVMIAVEVAGGPIGGWFGERSRDMRRALVSWSLVAGVLLAAVPFLSLGVALTAFGVLGFADGVTFTLLYLLPTYFPELTGGLVALGLALLNFVQILIGGTIALGFAFVAATFGYVGAWTYTGVTVVVFLPALLLAGPSYRRDALRPAAA